MRLGSPTGLYDVRFGEDMHVLIGCGLGGGSLINAGVALRPDPRVFRDPVWPDEIAQDGLLDEGYARAARWVRPARDPRGGRAHQVPGAAARAAALGKAAGARAGGGRASTATVNPAGVAQPACTRCGDCCGGCNVGAKNTVALTYLPDAARHGAEIFTHAKVRHVAKAPEGGWRVHFERQDGAGGAASASVTADMVVLAAGTLGSTEILLRSREQGLPCPTGWAGASPPTATSSPSATAPSCRSTPSASGIPPRSTGSTSAPASRARSRSSTSTTWPTSLTIQEGVLPSALAPMLPALFIPNGRLLGALKSLIAGVYKGPFASLQTFFAVSHDSASGRLVLEDDRLALSWPGAKDEPVYARLDAALEALVGQAGGSYVKNPLAGTMMGQQPATAHPLGGCGMGRERGDGVVDHKCRVFDARPGAGAADVHEGLYVIDGAIMPRSLGVNPLLTITALAERAMLHLARDRGLAFDDAPRRYATPISVTAPGQA